VNTPLTIPARGVLANDSDPDGDPLTAVLVTGPAHGTLTLDADGSFNYTPAAGYSGPDSFTYRAGDGQLESGVATVRLTSGVLFADDFGASTPNAAWRTVGGSWAWQDGLLSQEALLPGDFQKAILADKAYPADVEVAARVRVDRWVGGDSARAGLSLAQDAAGRGYNLLFRDGGVQFLDDHVAWGNFYAFQWQVGTWYHFKLRSAGGVLSGKVWADGAAEPTAWMFTQAGWTGRAGGAPGLNGGSGGAAASFDDVVVTAGEATSQE
jgi:hypothetical protein